MGVFDMVHVPCPNCGEPVEFQSKALYGSMDRFTLENAPTPILIDIMNAPDYCMACGQWVALIDPRHPPDWKPNLRIVKIRTPEKPSTHFQGFKWCRIMSHSPSLIWPSRLIRKRPTSREEPRTQDQDQHSPDGLVRPTRSAASS